MRAFWVTAIVVLTLQLIALVVYSTHLYSRFDVSVDFAHNVQAWYLIGHGHLSPTDTVRITATPFWRDHFDLIIWPLSLLRFIWVQPVILLWVQDVAIVAAEFVTLLWAAAIISERLPRYRVPAGIIALVALVSNSWWYETVSFDIHMPPLGLPLVVLCAYSFWSGRYRRAVISGALCLLLGAVTAELVVIVGIAALCSSRVRRSGGIKASVGVLVIGLAWMGLVNVLGANQASNLVANYGYLAGTTPKVTLFSIAKGLAFHPHRGLTVVHERWKALVFELAPTGWLGLLTPWGLFAFLGVLIPALLTQSPAYSTPTGGAFQNLPAMPFIYIGSVMVITRIATLRSWSDETDRPKSHVRSWARGFFGRFAKMGPAAASVLAAAAMFIAVGQGATMVHRIPGNWLLINSKQAATLAQATTLIPENAQVIVSYGVIGRFSERKYVLTLAAAPQQFDIYTRDVVFVITPTLGVESENPLDARADIKQVVNKLHAKVLLSANGVAVLQWEAPSNTKTIWLDGRYPTPPS